MAVVTVHINDRPYQIACRDGQEEHVSRRAAEFASRVGKLSGSVGPVGDSLLLVMAGVLLTDELAEARAAAQAPTPPRREPPGEELDAALAAAVEALAARIDGIADRLRTA